MPSPEQTAAWRQMVDHDDVRQRAHRAALLALGGLIALCLAAFIGGCQLGALRAQARLAGDAAAMAKSVATIEAGWRSALLERELAIDVLRRQLVTELARDTGSPSEAEPPQ